MIKFSQHHRCVNFKKILKRAVSALIIFNYLAGCSSLRSVDVADLDWSPSDIAEKNCASPSGNYSNDRSSIFTPIYAGESLYIYHNELKRLQSEGKNLPPRFGWRGVQTKVYAGKSVVFETDADRVNFYRNLTFSISVEDGTFTQTIKQLDQQYVTPMNTAMAGCYRGALVFRYIDRSTGADFTPVTISYGETEIRWLGNGDLQVTRRHRQRNLSLNSGALGPVSRISDEVALYPLIH